MADGPDLSQTPSQAAPPDTQNLPANTRPGVASPGSVAPPPAPAPAAPNPQQQDLAKHALIGKAVSALMGTTTNYQVDPTTGQTVAVPQKQTPGQWGRSMVLGAMLGLAAASDSKPQGGAVGGFLGGFGRGGQAVMQHNEQQDELRRQQAQQQFQNQQRVQQQQREQSAENRAQQAFPLEQQHRQAMIAAENAQTLRTQQLMKGESFQLFKEQAQFGQVMTQVYHDAGIDPIAKEKTPDDLQQILASNPKAIGWDWEQTGVKVITRKDGTIDYVPTFEAYDPTRTVRLTSGFIDRMKKADVDSVFPGTTDRLREGQELSPTDFAALKGLYQNAYNQKLQQSKDELTLEESRLKIDQTKADIEKLKAEANKQGRADKQASLLADGLTAWNTKLDEISKSNPNATHLDAFKALPPKQQFEISSNLVKTSQDLNRQIKDALSQVPPDQQRAQDLMTQLDGIRQMQKITVGAGVASGIPKAPKPGTTATPDLVQQALDSNGGDPAKANQVLMSLGYADTMSAGPKKPPSPVAQRNQNIVGALGKAAQFVESIPKP